MTKFKISGTAHQGKMEMNTVDSVQLMLGMYMCVLCVCEGSQKSKPSAEASL